MLVHPSLQQRNRSVIAEIPEASDLTWFVLNSELAGIQRRFALCSWLIDGRVTGSPLFQMDLSTYLKLRYPREATPVMTIQEVITVRGCLLTFSPHLAGKYLNTTELNWIKISTRRRISPDFPEPTHWAAPSWSCSPLTLTKIRLWLTESNSHLLLFLYNYKKGESRYRISYNYCILNTQSRNHKKNVFLKQISTVFTLLTWKKIYKPTFKIINFFGYTCSMYGSGIWIN